MLAQTHAPLSIYSDYGTQEVKSTSLFLLIVPVTRATSFTRYISFEISRGDVVVRRLSLHAGATSPCEPLAGKLVHTAHSCRARCG